MNKEKLDDKLSQKESSDLFTLVLLNDDINTFDHVIKALVEICGHDGCQAEQCAMIAHFKGSCDVKTGTLVSLSSMSADLGIRGLKSKVERL